MLAKNHPALIGGAHGRSAIKIAVRALKQAANRIAAIRAAVKCVKCGERTVRVELENGPGSESPFVRRAVQVSVGGDCQRRGGADAAVSAGEGINVSEQACGRESEHATEGVRTTFFHCAVETAIGTFAQGGGWVEAVNAAGE